MTDEEIRVYQSLWKNMLLVIGCLALVFGGCTIIRISDFWVTKVFGGWLCVAFFGCRGLFIFIVTLYNRIHHAPVLTIYENRLEIHEQIKGVNYIVNFADVKGFRLIKVKSVKMIAIDYEPTTLTHKIEEASKVKQQMMIYNLKKTGAIENIAVHNLTMRGKDICDLLNVRLGKFK